MTNLPLIYLDMSALNRIKNGDILWRPDLLQAVISNEHYTEMSRATYFTDLTDCLTEIHAMELAVDCVDGRVVNSAQINPVPDFAYRAAEHINNMKVGQSSLALARSYMAYFYGAIDASSLIAEVEKLPDILNELLGENLPPEIDQRGRRAVEGLVQMTRTADLWPRGDVGVLEAFAIGKQQIDNLPSDTVFDEIWKIVRPIAGDATRDQFFGVDPIDKQGYETWPRYLAAAGLYSMLNLFRHGKDKGLQNPKRTANILSDGAHTANAMFCDALITHDKGQAKKARAIYAYLGARTVVTELQHA